MTSELVRVFPHRGGRFQIEPDASSGSYFWGAGWLVFVRDLREARDNDLANLGRPLKQGESLFIRSYQKSDLTVSAWPDTHWQIDADFTVFYRAHKVGPPVEISRRHDLGDSIMTGIVIAPLASQPIRFTDLGRLRVQECERVVALRTELTKCGAKVIEEGDTLTVYPSQLHGAEIETYNDHRMAMCFAILGLKVPGIKIKNPACVKKTFPNFFQKLAAAPPQGLGATILDASGRKLAHDELFAD
jgi:3-phosphoshikimate 1-carboxyvinyltransferase